MKERTKHIPRLSSTMLHFSMLMILVAWLFQARGKEIYPAKIFANKNRDILEFTCSTYGLKDGFQNHSTFHIYLCRNGFGIDTKISFQDATFFIDEKKKDNAGNYSCVFSVDRYSYKEVRGHGLNSIFITVNDSFTPAEIILPETSVKAGSDVEIQCTSLKLPERNQKGNIYAFLDKNGTVIQVNIWDTVKNEVRFTLKEVTTQDAGTYICFVMSEPCPFPEKVHGVNEVDLHVTEHSYKTVMITIGGFSLLLLIILCLGLLGLFQKQVDCFQSERTAEHRNDMNTEMAQVTGEMQNELSFGSEWDDTSDSVLGSHERVYQNYPRQLIQTAQCYQS
ncbi:uncharacterized protein LOC124395838 isoform X2 [Silurus meridionalis]|uniref:uncharacterized protein LOC124395838 isoform X2 n=1 Tax=Silurus meridionalis TaxID=175797 RepID=UPI001EEA2EDC|nr:uncharacterized protein LOC124395838 isoform X2 [Silurus meridionalis]